MREALLSALRAVTQEERELLQGKELRRARYTSGRDFTIDGRKFLQGGKLMAVRAHTRFVAFPCHRHNYVEICRIPVRLYSLAVRAYGGMGCL